MQVVVAGRTAARRENKALTEEDEDNLPVPPLLGRAGLSRDPEKRKTQLQAVAVDVVNVLEAAVNDTSTSGAPCIEAALTLLLNHQVILALYLCSPLHSVTHRLKPNPAPSWRSLCAVLGVLDVGG